MQKYEGKIKQAKTMVRKSWELVLQRKKETNSIVSLSQRIYRICDKVTLYSKLKRNFYLKNQATSLKENKKTKLQN